MITQLPYGLKDGILVSIDEVGRGLSCECVCPSCGADLVARKGESRVSHFAHYKGTACEHALETALHLAAKKILAKERRFQIPEYRINDERVDNEETNLSETRMIRLDSVKLEKRIQGIRPDLVVTSSGRTLLIEIFVSHRVDIEKRKKVKELDLSMIEVDLRKLDDGFTNEELRVAVIESIDNKKWIHNSRDGLLVEKLLKKEEKKQNLNSVNPPKSEDIYGYKLWEKVEGDFGCEIIRTNSSGTLICPKNDISPFANPKNRIHYSSCNSCEFFWDKRSFKTIYISCGHKNNRAKKTSTNCD